MKLRYLLAALLGTGALTLATVGIASAAANTKASGNVGSSSIPRSTFKQDMLSATAQVLNTTTTQVQAARKNHTFSQLLKNAGLTRQTFRQKLKAQLTSELKGQGYSQDQITIALQHRTIVRLRHHDKD